MTNCESIFCSGVSSCALSFNGGKDCTVLLEIIYNHCLLKDEELLVFHVSDIDSFQEVEDFVDFCKLKYPRIQLITICENNLKNAFAKLIDDYNQIKLIFIGVRKTDPFCQGLKEFTPSDNGWPQVMRCLPLLEWTYADIWQYLKEYNVSYCQLYDLGYTSLGTKSTTTRNPNLLSPTINEYLPADMLTDSTLERAGRISKPTH